MFWWFWFDLVFGEGFIDDGDFDLFDCDWWLVDVEDV